MKSRFSRRVLGKDTGPSMIVQKDFMNDDLRNSLWNMLDYFYLKNKNLDSFYLRKSFFYRFYQLYFLAFLKQPVDQIRDDYDYDFQSFRIDFFQFEWYEVYDFLEFLVNHIDDADLKKEVKNVFNNVLEAENSAYRFVGDDLSEIVSNDEIEEVEKAINHEGKFHIVKEHLSQAISLMSDRRAPDFRNSVKESISSVESLASLIVGERGTLGQLIKALEHKKIIPTTIKNAYSSLYGFTSNEHGIRHAMHEKSDLNYADARYMLIVCSAFVNYVIETVETE